MARRPAWVKNATDLEQGPMDDPADTTHEPVRLADWTDFHRKVESLPDQEREVFDLVWYQGMSQAEAADVLQVSVPTIKRRWLSARLRLQTVLDDE
jgi:RNA polymerase sigma factor (sigma-70 family)